MERANLHHFLRVGLHYTQRDKETISDIILPFKEFTKGYL